MGVCSRCGGPTVGGGMGGEAFCSTRGCGGNYWGGDARLERANEEAVGAPVFSSAGGEGAGRAEAERDVLRAQLGALTAAVDAVLYQWRWGAKGSLDGDLEVLASALAVARKATRAVQG